MVMVEVGLCSSDGGGCRFVWWWRQDCVTVVVVEVGFCGVGGGSRIVGWW